jgi:VWFA-related protein
LFSTVAESEPVIYSVYYEVDPHDLLKKLLDSSSRIQRRNTPPERNEPIKVPEGRPKERDFQREGPEFMQRLAEETAGRYYRGDVKNLNRTFARVIDELQQQYLLGFYPEQSDLDGNVHSLRIEVSRQGAVVRGRNSYRAAGREVR